jgi:hypothetical protein
LRQAARWLREKLSTSIEPVWIDRDNVDDVPEAIAAEWSEWWSEGLWCVPISGRGEVRAWAIYLLEQPPDARAAHAVGRLASTWGYCWTALAPTRRRLVPRVTRRRALDRRGLPAGAPPAFPCGRPHWHLRRSSRSTRR